MNINIRILIKSAGLVVATILVLILYQFYVNPVAESVLMAKAAGEIPGKTFSLAETLAGAEQAFCLILFIWVVFFVMMEQFSDLKREKLTLERNPMPYEEEAIRPEDAMSHVRPLERLPENEQTRLLPRALRRALSRFHAGHSTEDVSRAVSSVCEEELARLESRATTVRYVAWAIPSIGFVGTVRGIGLGLGLASEAVASGDISPVTGALGLAFNSTLIALLISLVLMLLIHWLQGSQEDFVQEVERYCDEHCVDRLEQNA